MLSFRKKSNRPGASTVLLWAAAAAGLVLRLFQVQDQILLDDELHSVAKLATSDYAGIARTFGVADHSIPLTLAFKWIAEQGRLSEAWMIAPAWVAGVAACLFALRVVRRATSPLAFATFAGLLAISPLIVMYTRQARPYAITLFLSLVALWAAYRWSEQRRLRHALLYFATAIPAVYFHMIVGPLVLGVWVYFLVEALAGDYHDRRRIASIVAMGALAGVLTAIAIGPPLVNDWDAVRAKTGTDLPTLHTLERAAMMTFGTASAIAAAIAGFFAVIGAAVLARRFPRPTRYVASLVALQVACVLVSKALWLSHALVLLRYLLVVVPFLLFAAAVGFAWCFDWLLSRSAWAGGALAAALLAALYVTGPLPAALAYPNAFFQHRMFFLDFDPAENPEARVLLPGPIPAFYRELGKLPARSKILIEAPWRYENMFNRLPVFQRVHRQKVEIGLVGSLCPPGPAPEHGRLLPNRFRHFVDLAQPPAELRRRADYVVFHRSLELSNMVAPWHAPGGKALPPVEGCIAAFRSSFGAPVFEDDTITVFALRGKT